MTISKPRKLSPKAQAKHDEARVSQAYTRACSGIQIDMMAIPKVFEVGLASVATGDDDTTLGAKLRAYVDTIREH